ncbi:MAG: tetratricopeptide repeat protein [Myxococcota bacterium]
MMATKPYHLGTTITLLIGFVFAGCAGSSGAGSGSVSDPGGEKQGTSTDGTKLPSSIEKAEELFAKLSEEVSSAPQDSSIDPDWLKSKYQEVLALNPDHLPARFSLAVLEEQAGRTEAALEQYRQINKDDPGFAPAAENLASYWVLEGDIPRATSLYKQIIERDPKNLTSRLSLARLLSQEGEYTKAIELCRQVLQRKADAAEAFRILAKSYKSIGNMPMAELVIGRGLKVNKDDVELHHLMAEILWSVMTWQGVSKLKEVVRMDPKNVSVRAELAAIALKYLDYGNAAQQYEAIAKQKPDDRATQVGLAVSYKGLGRYDQAEKIYQQLLRKDKDDLDALWNLAVLYHHNLSRYDEASKYYREYKSAAPRDDKKAAEVNQMVAEIEKAKSNQAAEQARLERDRKRQEAVDAVCSKVAGGGNAAAEIAGLGGEQERNDIAWQLFTNGQGLMQTGDLPGGEVQIECALAVIPDTPQAKAGTCAPMYVLWTQILYQLNRLNEASSAIDKALVCDPSNPDAGLIRQQLDEITAQGAP